MKIVKSAIRYKGEIYSGYNHEECFNELFKKHIKNSINSKDIEQGFITSENEFVNRIQATIIAETSGQLAINLKAGVDPLTSEDMHITWLHEKDKEIEQLEKENELLKSQMAYYVNIAYEVINSNSGNVKIFPCHRCGKLCNYDADYPYTLCYECDKQLNTEVYEKFEKELKKQEKKIKVLERENEFLKKQNSLMYQQGIEQGKFDKQMEQEYE